ncbi:DUF5984 family protein [Kitasatospora sp. NBC_00240]|uniref:DUF5984 family protein n=1 Tax=Kitasatospora sp. NBC_00240 TaxID=2903567 RepID=UPI002259F1F8|nr:DUF5984 family protein [Kitasatospora sp. NBC_00240]MCX5211089.1 DUF5984 family protein [Kitasatospora sp. NBC_00240]
MSGRLRFRFELRALADVGPWGGERNPDLHWFALTQGCYWIELGGQELLRYSERTLRRWRDEAGGDVRPYADYFVVRIWEDVLEILADVLEPVPPDLVTFVSSDLAGHPLWDEDDLTHEAEAASDWHGRRSMYMGPLVNAPQMRWWRTVDDDGDRITVSWSHEPGHRIEFAASPAGRLVLPTGDYLAAVAELDGALLAAMEQRVAALEASGPPSGVELDLEHLRHEHRDRAAWLERARARTPATDWPAVRAGAREFLAAGPALPPAEA